MTYRIIKRKNSIHKDVDEFVLQTDSQLGQWHQVPQRGFYDALPSTTWYIVQVFSTLEAAQDRKEYLLTGLAPGETIVG